MKKWMMTLAVVLMIAGTAQAQVFQIGVRAGINRADVTAEEILDMGDDQAISGPRIGRYQTILKCVSKIE